jgi:DNA-3-methyladenine glycosylase I
MARAVSRPDLGAAIGADGLARCPWAASADPLYRDYHDHEWGQPLHGQAELFERICLEAFQSGLSWLTILRKRPAFRAAFADFDPQRVAAFGEPDVDRLMRDTGIVRNQRKIVATIANARAVADLDQSLDELIWSFQPPPRPRPASTAAVPATTPESIALAKALRTHGFRFVGPTTCYALMQAVGLVDDHLDGCHVPPIVTVGTPTRHRQ